MKVNNMNRKKRETLEEHDEEMCSRRGKQREQVKSSWKAVHRGISPAIIVCTKIYNLYASNKQTNKKITEQSNKIILYICTIP